MAEQQSEVKEITNVHQNAVIIHRQRIRAVAINSVINIMTQNRQHRTRFIRDDLFRRFDSSSRLVCALWFTTNQSAPVVIVVVVVVGCLVNSCRCRIKRD